MHSALYFVNIELNAYFYMKYKIYIDNKTEIYYNTTIKRNGR